MQHPDVVLTSFDARTARAVVAVLRRAGVPATARAGGDDDLEVTVPVGAREEAMRILGSRMEEVREAVASADVADRRAAPAPIVHDPDDVHAGPPLVMERLRSMKVFTAVVLVPLMVVTLAPTLRGDVRVVVAVVLMLAFGLLIWRRRRMR